MTDFTAKPALEADELLAREIEKKWNAELRRPATRASTRVETDPATPPWKKRRRMKSTIPLTPESCAPSSITNSPEVLNSTYDASSSDLSSVPTSPEWGSVGAFSPGITLGSTSMCENVSSDDQQRSPKAGTVESQTERCKTTLNYPSTISLLKAPAEFSRHTKRGPKALTEVRVTEADFLSTPPPGPELMAIVELLKEERSLPKVHHPSVFRFINGQWMAPQMCDNCQAIGDDGIKPIKRPFCDRTSPCSTCRKEGIQCIPGMFMAKVFCKTKSLPMMASLESKEQVWNPTFLKHLNQNLDGTWMSPFETIPENSRLRRRTNTKILHSKLQKGYSRPRAATSPDPTTTGMNIAANIYQKLDGTWNVENCITPQPRLRKLKRKLEDLDLDPTPGGPALPFEFEDEPDQAKPPQYKSSRRRESDKYFRKSHESAQADKPAPYGEPPVWASKRQQLCETLPYYRAYQSGIYIQDGTARAFMVDKEVGPRDKLDEEILIARVGGGRTLDVQSGRMINTVHQERSAFAMGFQRARNFGLPVAVIAGQGNRLSPSKLPHYYCVFDWFHVTDVWCEVTQGVKCWMVRLEKMALNTKSWWAPCISAPIDPEREYSSIRTLQRQCPSCQDVSKEIYNAGWACLNPKCELYFQFVGQPDGFFDDDLLDYNETFLKERTPLHLNHQNLDPLVPPLLTNEDVEQTGGFGIEAKFKCGIVCPKCKGCSRRIEWNRWICEHGCDFTHSVQQKIVPVVQAISHSIHSGREQCDTSFGIRFSQKASGLYDVYEYTIPGLEPLGPPAGFIRHFKANGLINRQIDGPNDLFRLMQEKDFGLRRHPARQAGSTGEILTSHWAANWGAPYKYGVAVLSRGFDEAPPVIIKAVKRLTWAGNQAVSENLEPFKDFNELLSIGYFEESSIGYHDDGEKELGPTVATLSLGASALMSFRPKAKVPIGARSKNFKGTKPDVMRIVLDHGDIIIMHGSEIQKLYEHAVTPQGKLRFALTCRYIRPDSIDDADERENAVLKGTLPAGHEKLNYDGDAVLRPDFIVSDNATDGSSGTDPVNDLTAMLLSGEISERQLAALREAIRRESLTMTPDFLIDTTISKSGSDITVDSSTTTTESGGMRPMVTTE